MSGLRFESMADMPPRMRELYARQQIDLSGAARQLPFTRGARGRQSITTSGPSGTGSSLTAGSRRGGMTS